MRTLNELEVAEVAGAITIGGCMQPIIPYPPLSPTMPDFRNLLGDGYAD
jgi:hypothetical protein